MRWFMYHWPHIKGNKNVDMGAVKKWLEDFYRKYNPEKLKPGYIVKILNQFKGREDDLMLEIRTKYVWMVWMVY